VWIFLKLFSFQKSTFSTANGCCCIFMNGYFLLFNCYFSHLGFIIRFYSQVFPFASFHSNTIINVFIDFSLRYRLLLYRKPAFKKKWRRDDFYTEYIVRGVVQRTSTSPCPETLLIQQHDQQQEIYWKIKLLVMWKHSRTFKRVNFWRQLFLPFFQHSIHSLAPYKGTS